jgi:hypothetical protein
MKNNNMKLEEIIKEICSRSSFRKELTKNSLEYFASIYFPEYIKYPSAGFHKDFMRLAQDQSKKIVGIVSFRGSAKSTYLSTIFPIWSMIGKQQVKYCLLVARTQAQARQMLKNIKKELEARDLLKMDLGPFQEESNQWSVDSLVLDWYGARISAISMDQAVRGIRHNQFRPQLMIFDDIEDIYTVRTQESRDRTASWIGKEIIPAGDIGTRQVHLGNNLHPDSYLNNLERRIKLDPKLGEFLRIPLIDDNNNCLWPGKYPTQQVIDQEKANLGSEEAWDSEMLLKYIDPVTQIININNLSYYEKLPRT